MAKRIYDEYEIYSKARPSKQKGKSKPKTKMSYEQYKTYKAKKRGNK